MNLIIGFEEHERKSLLGKIINYFDSSTMLKYQPISMSFDYSINDKKKELSKYFSNYELIMILKRIGYEEKNIINYMNLFKHNLTNANINKIWHYLYHYRGLYFSNYNLNSFLFGLVGNIRTKREKTIKNLIEILYYNNKIPIETILLISNYLDNTDKNLFFNYFITNNKKINI